MDRDELLAALLRERFGPDAQYRPSTTPSTDHPQDGGERPHEHRERDRVD